MKFYEVKERDVFSKTAKFFINNELICKIYYNPNYPWSTLFEPLSRGSFPVKVDDMKKIPTIGMKYVDGYFFDGENGETFDKKENDPDGPIELTEVGQWSCICSINDENVVDGIHLFNIYMIEEQDSESVFLQIAAIMSNAEIIIEDGAEVRSDLSYPGKFIQKYELKDWIDYIERYKENA